MAAPLAGSRTITPPTGSGVSSAIPARSSAFELTVTTWPPRGTIAGLSGAASSSSQRVGMRPSASRLSCQPEVPTIHSPSGVAAARSAIRACTSATELRVEQLHRRQVEAEIELVDVGIDQPRHRGPSPEVEDLGIRPRMGRDLVRAAHRDEAPAAYGDRLGGGRDPVDRADVAVGYARYRRDRRRLPAAPGAADGSAGRRPSARRGSGGARPSPRTRRRHPGCGRRATVQSRSAKSRTGPPASGAERDSTPATSIASCIAISAASDPDGSTARPTATPWTLPQRLTGRERRLGEQKASRPGAERRREIAADTDCERRRGAGRAASPSRPGRPGRRPRSRRSRAAGPQGGACFRSRPATRRSGFILLILPVGSVRLAAARSRCFERRRGQRGVEGLGPFDVGKMSGILDNRELRAGDAPVQSLSDAGRGEPVMLAVEQQRGNRDPVDFGGPVEGERGLDGLEVGILVERGDAVP